MLNKICPVILQNAIDTVISKFAKKIHLAKSEADIDDLDIDKLKAVPVHLSKLTNVV